MVLERLRPRYELNDWQAWVSLAFRVVLGGVFIWAAIPKIVHPLRFLQAVRAYDATPEWLSKTIAFGLPMLELSLGVLLVIGLLTRWAAAVTGLLLVIFTIGIVQAWARGLKIDCGCFGGGGTTNRAHYLLEILRDFGLLFLVAVVILWPLSQLAVDTVVIRSEYVPELTAKQARNEKAVRRNAAAKAKAQHELALKQRYLAGGTAGAIALIAIVAIGVQASRAKIPATASIANATPANGVSVGNPQAPVTVDLYEDFQCPICKDLEDAGLATLLEAKTKATNIKVNYHVMSFLDRASNGTRYSSRAANAGYCAAEQSSDAFVKFHDILFGKDKQGNVVQPPENSNGRANADLIRYGSDAGITSADFSSCVNQEKHKELVSGVTDEASKRNVTGTPTVFVANKEVKASNGGVVTVADVSAAIDAALKVAKSTAAPSVSPTATGSAATTPKATATPKATTKPKATTPKATATPSATKS